MLIMRLAWRNVMRNKRRTFLSSLAVGAGLATLMVANALITGMLEGMIKTATDTFLGDGQIHARGFRDTFEVEKTILGSGEILASLKGEPDVKGFTPRTVSFGMLSSAANVSSVLLYGIDPETEKNISKIDEAMRKGAYLAADSDRGILIGSKLAENLEVDVGDRVVLTVAQANTGELSQEMFRISGVFHFGIRETDGGMAYVKLDKAKEMLALGDGIHEIALKLTSIEAAGDRSLPLWRKYSTSGNEALGWKDIVPQLEGVLGMSTFSAAIGFSLMFAIVSLIIMNTLFMSLYERMFEFGVMRAVGTRPSWMSLMIFLEAASISMISIAIGLAIGFLVTWYFSIYGIDYTGIEFAGVTMREFLYPVFRLRQYTLFPFILFMFTLAAAVYPAVFAAHLTPARAMRKSM